MRKTLELKKARTQVSPSTVTQSFFANPPAMAGSCWPQPWVSSTCLGSLGCMRQKQPPEEAELEEVVLDVDAEDLDEQEKEVEVSIHARAQGRPACISVAVAWQSHSALVASGGPSMSSTARRCMWILVMSSLSCCL
ncbi:hypothetical protein AAES_08037 [Amazona aestiva]|uniref:Uncharacterized protein n=1 Tax=Amazona aestiva TaxID=12930 RepID=A0A0Q3XAC3_AMAAE|nr:hypothetical protein AAES_08037 [Amazona aestiva]